MQARQLEINNLGSRAKKGTSFFPAKKEKKKKKGEEKEVFDEPARRGTRQQTKDQNEKKRGRKSGVKRIYLGGKEKKKGKGKHFQVP